MSIVYAIIGGVPGSESQLITNLLAQHNISYQENQPYVRHIKPEEGKLEITVEQVRQLSTNLWLALPEGVNQIIVFPRAEQLNKYAQNALLKILEEPPVNTYIFLCTRKQASLLPTILSRCFLHHQNTHISEKYVTEKGEVEKLYQAIVTRDINFGFRYCEKLPGSKEEVADIFNELFSLVRNEVARGMNRREIYYKLLAAKKYLRVNCNPRLVMENLFL